MFRALFSPISRSTWLYFHLVHDTGWQQHSWTISEAVNTVKFSWWWAKTSPKTCRADWVQINKPKSYWSSVTNYTKDAQAHKHQNLYSCGYFDVRSLNYWQRHQTDSKQIIMVMHDSTAWKIIISCILKWIRMIFTKQKGAYLHQNLNS